MGNNRLVKKVESLFEELNAMEQAVMNRAYQRFCDRGQQPGRALDDWLAAEEEAAWSPPVELGEHNGEYVLKAAVAGIDPKTLDVRVTADDVLITSEGEPHHHDESADRVHLCELGSGRLFRSIHFPGPVDPDKVKAEVKNGLLTLRAPRAQRAKTIEVEEG